MGRHSRQESYATTATTITTMSSSTFTFSSDQFDDHIVDCRLSDSLNSGFDVEWPFGGLEGLDKDDLRETAYEIFFTVCRSTPGFGGSRSALNNGYYQTQEEMGGGFSSMSPGKGGNGVGIAVTSKVKRSLGLKMLKRSPSNRTSFPYQAGSASVPSSPGSPMSPGAALLMQARQRRPLTSAELMRQQMRIAEYNDNRLRKTLLRILVGQMGRRAETIILPLELLRHLKPSEFNSSQDYHAWQRRQLKILESGLLINPSFPLDKPSSLASRLQEIIDLSETRPIDTNKNSETMRTLCNSVVSLAWRSLDGSPTEVCHWADGYPFNIHLYVALLNSVFDLREDTMVVDEVDELLELIKKTWSTLGIGRSMHNLCFAWTLFNQYIVTYQLEPDLLGAAIAVLNEVAIDAKRTDKESSGYLKMLAKAMDFMQCWSEKRLMNYHEYFHKGNVVVLEHLVGIALTSTKILNGGDISVFELIGQEKGSHVENFDLTRQLVDRYIRSSIRNAFVKILTSDQIIKLKADREESELLIQLADEVEGIALKEKECFSNLLKNWHPMSRGVAAVTLHTCYATELRRYLSEVTALTKATVAVLERAGKLERFLLQMVAECTESSKEASQGLMREISPFEVDSIELRLLRKWVVAKLTEVKECIHRAKDTESWNPMSKIEPFAHSGVELVRISQDAVNAFFDNPISIPENLVHDLADGLQSLFHDYASFVSSCGSKQNYFPALPPLTRCGGDSKLRKLLKKAGSQCNVGVVNEYYKNGSNEGILSQQPMSHGTQRLYVRLNTLHYLQSSLHLLDKTLTLAPRVTHSTRFISNKHKYGGISSSYFGAALAFIQTSIQHVAEVVGYRLIFLDSNSVFYDSLYVGGVSNARIRPALQLLKQNLTLLSTVVTDKAQPQAVKEVMKASFEGYLTVLLAGGPSRIYSKSDNHMIAEDFDQLKRVFATCGEGLLSEDVVEHEASVVEGVLELMSQSTEQLMEEFSIATCETSGIGLMSSDNNKLPMPPTTGRWNRSDPNTILRVLCYRKDQLANHFLKKTFQLARNRCP